MNRLQESLAVVGVKARGSTMGEVVVSLDRLADTTLTCSGESLASASALLRDRLRQLADEIDHAIVDAGATP